MSGMTKSTPRSSDSGNIMPASMTMMSSPTRRAIIFMPNAPSPPSGTTVRDCAGLLKEDFSPLCNRESYHSGQKFEGYRGCRGFREPKLRFGAQYKEMPRTRRRCRAERLRAFVYDGSRGQAALLGQVLACAYALGKSHGSKAAAFRGSGSTSR